MIPLAFLATFSIGIWGCSSEKKDNPIPALYDSKEQAERAAPKFGCKGSHKMGEKWMPCKKHGGNLNHNKSHGHKHNN